MGRAETAAAAARGEGDGGPVVVGGRKRCVSKDTCTDDRSVLSGKRAIEERATDNKPPHFIVLLNQIVVVV